MYLTKISINNLMANRFIYFPYLVMNIAFSTFIYIIGNLLLNTSINKMASGSALKALLGLGLFLLILIFGAFSVYSDGYLNKQRNHELGLYAILGMRKRQLILISTIQEAIIFGVSFLVGIIGGILYSHLAFLFVKRLTGISVTFELNLVAALLGTFVIICIFLMIVLLNVRSIKKLDIISLFQSQQKSEDTVKRFWIPGTFSLFILVLGYSIAIFTKNISVSIPRFEVSALLVILGIFGLFTSASVMILHMLKNNNKVYYTTNSFIIISGMIHRLKKSSTSLALICILCTATLISLSTLSCVFVGKNSLLKTWYPREVMVIQKSEGPFSKVNMSMNKSAKKADIKMIDNRVIRISQPNYIDLTRDKVGSDNSVHANFQVSVITTNSFNRAEHKNITLKGKQIGLYIPGKSITTKNMKLNGLDAKVKYSFSKLGFAPVSDNSIVPNIYVITNNKMIQKRVLKSRPLFRRISGFNVVGTIQSQKLFFYDVQGQKSGYLITTKLIMQRIVNSFLGGFMFIGGILSFIFMLITAVTIYYKQLADGNEDRGLFTAMKKVGMSNSQIKRLINFQILILFLLPLLFSVINLLVAFPIISKVLKLFSLRNDTLFAETNIITIIAFSFIYAITCVMTSRNYLHIIDDVQKRDE